MRHVGDARALVGDVLEDLPADPDRQHDEAAHLPEAEEDDHPIEEIHLAQPEDDGEEPHQPRDRARRAHRGQDARRIHEVEHRVAGEPAREIQEQVPEAAQRAFDRRPHDEEEHHVADEVHEAAVQEHAGEPGDGARLGRHEAEATVGDLAQERLEARPVLFPLRVGRVLRRDDAPGVKLAHEGFVRLHAPHQGRRIGLVDEGRELGIRLAQPLLERGQLEARQRRRGIGLERLRLAGGVAGLVEKEDQAVDEDEGDGDGRRPAPVESLDDRDDQQAASPRPAGAVAEARGSASGSAR